jgi:putative methionine-R-sulfoxide reductase with GAF domain
MESASDSVARIVEFILATVQAPATKAEEAVQANFKNLLELAIEPLGDAASGWRATIFALDASEEILRHCASIGSGEMPDMPEVELTENNGVLARVALRQKAECVNGRESKGASPPDHSPHEHNTGNSGSEFVAPLISSGNTVGVFRVAAPNSGAFPQAVAEYLTKVAGLAAVLVQHGEQSRIAQEREMYHRAYLSLIREQFEREMAALDEEELLKTVNSDGPTFKDLIAELDTLAGE